MCVYVSMHVCVINPLVKTEILKFSFLTNLHGNLRTTFKTLC